MPASRRAPRQYAQPKPVVDKAGHPQEGLDVLSKDGLLQLAAEKGVQADSSMTKAEIRAAIEAG